VSAERDLAGDGGAVPEVNEEATSEEELSAVGVPAEGSELEESLLDLALEGGLQIQARGRERPRLHQGLNKADGRGERHRGERAQERRSESRQQYRKQQAQKLRRQMSIRPS
jgi:hypothetical protein